MKIALAQINTKVGDLEGNYHKVLEYITKAKVQNCDLIVFPELTLTGYPPEDLILKDDFILKQFQYINKIIDLNTEIHVALGVVTMSLKNACIITKGGLLHHVWYKQHLPNYSVFDEKRYFKTQQPNKYFVDIKNTKIGFNICEDIWERDVTEKQVKEGAEIIVNMSSSPYYSGKLQERKKMLREKAKNFGVEIMYCNLVGGQDELVFDGGSMVLDKDGAVINEAKQFQEQLLIRDTECNMVINNGLPNTIQKEVYEALKLGLKDYVEKNGFKKVVLGLSGGIDSALVAKLAVDAIGSDNVHGISMPTKYNSDVTKNDAKKLAKNLNIKFNEFPIQDIFNNYRNSLLTLIQERGTTIENLQARIRGNIIMAVSNDSGALPLSTGNKSEIAVGYCTLYGDMNGGFNVIKDLYKTQVFELSRWLGLPKSIIERPPSAELKADQKDQDSLPPYEILDKIIKKLMEDKKSPSNDLEKKIARLLRLSEYKRRQACPGIKISKTSFGKDWRNPITNGYLE